MGHSNWLMWNDLGNSVRDNHVLRWRKSRTWDKNEELTSSLLVLRFLRDISVERLNMK